MKLGIVVSETYWEEITSKMLELALEAAQEAGAEVSVVKVPGAFDIPLGVKKLLATVDGVVTLGAVVKGETAHDEVICHAVAAGLVGLSLESGKPVVLGVNGPRMNREQAVARIGRARKVTEACVELVKNSQ
jgi:6,7-dimethyl-8-ribityllumazine synthase